MRNRFRESKSIRQASTRTCPVELPGRWAAEQDSYLVSLASAPLSAQTRRTYASKARQYLAWLAVAETDGDALGTVEGRDWAVRDYRSHLQTVLKRRPATVNGALAAVDDFYIRRGLGPARALRVDLPDAAPRALEPRAQAWGRGHCPRPWCGDR